jgi:hypothetical protein
MGLASGALVAGVATATFTFGSSASANGGNRQSSPEARSFLYRSGNKATSPTTSTVTSAANVTPSMASLPTPLNSPPASTSAASVTSVTSAASATLAASRPIAAAKTPETSFSEGAYAGPANPSGIASFAKTTGTKATIASDYLPASSGWTGMDGSGGSLTWLTGAYQGTGYTLSLGVPIIPTDANGVALGTLAMGATGAYNSYFVTLAQTLIAAGDANAYLRLGWEFDGTWYAWDASTPAAEASYASYFQQIVTAMRTVPGQAFKYVWNPDASAFTPDQSVIPDYDVSLAYPGSAYVNYIGLDLYDQSWTTPQTPVNAWASTSLPTLTAARSFASAQGKPLAFCEWGIAIRSDGHGLGDDPLFIDNMTAWMSSAANNVSFESYFDYNTLPVGGDTNADITGGSFPNSLAAFIKDLG